MVVGGAEEATQRIALLYLHRNQQDKLDGE